MTLQPSDVGIKNRPEDGPAPLQAEPARPRAGRIARIAVQAVVTIALLAALGWLAREYNVRHHLRTIRPADGALAGGLLLLACAINSLRWKLLLANAGISRSLPDLFGLYLMGFFFSMFLPTGSGGDVVRIYDVARKSGRVSAAVVATLQERLLGLGVSMLVGLAASFYYFDRLPIVLRTWVLLAQVVGPIGMAVLLYPTTITRPFAALWRRAPRGLKGSRVVNRIGAAVTSLASVTPLSPGRLTAVTLVSVVGVLLTISVYWVLGRSLQVGVDYAGLCLIVPLVWVIRLLPITLGGHGVGELAIVYLLREIFNAPLAPATALAFAFLALQIGLALLGGLVLAVRVMRFRGAYRSE